MCDCVCLCVYVFVNVRVSFNGVFVHVCRVCEQYAYL